MAKAAFDLQSILNNPMAMSAIIGLIVYLVLDYKLIEVELPKLFGMQMEPMHAGLAAAAAYYVVTEYVMADPLERPQGPGSIIDEPLGPLTGRGDLGFYDY